MNSSAKLGGLLNATFLELLALNFESPSLLWSLQRSNGKRNLLDSLAACDVQHPNY